MSIEVHNEGNMLTILVDEKSQSSFRDLVQRGANLWPDAPAKIKAFADLVTGGHVQQPYEDIPRTQFFTRYHRCSCGYVTALQVHGKDDPKYPIRCTNPEGNVHSHINSDGNTVQVTAPCMRSESFNDYAPKG